MDLNGASATFVPIDGVPTSWATYARGRGEAWQTEYSGTYDGSPHRGSSLE